MCASKTKTTVTTKKVGRKLTDKQRAFCEAYCNYGCSGIDAIYAAGYKVKSRNTAYSMASEYLRKPEILAYIQNIYQDFNFSDEAVMHEHWFLIRQHFDLSNKARAIDMYYKKKGMYKSDPQEVKRHRPYEHYTDEELNDAMEKMIERWAK